MLHIFFFALALAMTTGAKGEKVPNTAVGIFQEAVAHWGSSSTDAAMVAIADAHTGKEQMACIEVDALARAVLFEDGLIGWAGNIDHVTRRMHSQQDRRFVFSNAEALRILGKGRSYADFDDDLCKFIRKNVYAFRNDRPATLIVRHLHNP